MFSVGLKDADDNASYMKITQKKNFNQSIANIHIKLYWIMVEYPFLLPETIAIDYTYIRDGCSVTGEWVS